VTQLDSPPRQLLTPEPPAPSPIAGQHQAGAGGAAGAVQGPRQGPCGGAWLWGDGCSVYGCVSMRVGAYVCACVCKGELLQGSLSVLIWVSKVLGRLASACVCVVCELYVRVVLGKLVML
jgi:hypothetical protein